MKKTKKLKTLLIAFSMAIAISGIPVYASEPENGKSGEVDASETEDESVETVNTFTGCKDSAIKLSVSCTANDEFKFECNDKCKMNSRYTGYSSISVGAFSKYSKNYELVFTKSGEHIIAVYKNGKLMEYDKVIVSEHKYSEWSTTKKATIFETGTKTRKCKNCGYKDYKTIQKKKASVTIKKKVSLKKGKTLELKILKKTKGDKVSSWKSSNKKVATVNSKGIVKSKKKGTAKITVKMKSGCKATCTVKVK